MSMDEAPRAIFMTGPADQYPPWTDDQRDAQIEALRMAVFRIVQELEEAGILTARDLAAQLQCDTAFFEGTSHQTVQALRTLSYLLHPPGSSR